MNIGSITVSRSDFGRMLTIYEKIQKHSSMNLKLFVSGNHFHKDFGNTIQHIKDSGIQISRTHQVSNIYDPSKMSAEILAETAHFLKENKIECLLVLGDRFEMLAVAQAALLCSVPIIHIGGGHVTAGAIDEQIRGAISQLATYHLVASQQGFKIVEKMGIESKNIVITGAPDLDSLRMFKADSRKDFLETYQLNPDKNFVLVTIHPETKLKIAEHQIFVKNIYEALKKLPQQIIITSPCADKGCKEIFQMIEMLKHEKKDLIYIQNLGQKNYFNAMYHAYALLGNSSSGIIESASIPVPAINIGKRQEGREQGNNVINSTADFSDIIKAVESIESEQFQRKIQNTINPYGDGYSSEKIITFLEKTFQISSSFKSMEIAI